MRELREPSQVRKNGLFVHEGTLFIRETRAMNHIWFEYSEDLNSYAKVFGTNKKLALDTAYDHLVGGSDDN